MSASLLSHYTFNYNFCVNSTEIPPIIDFLGDYYRDVYKAIRYDPDRDDWPPNQIKLNVNVTLIHYKSGRTQEELIEIVKRHEEGASAVDDVASSEPKAKRPRLGNSKVTKNLTDIFAADPAEEKENSVPPRRILIEGAPGIGKTVIAKEIAFLWANGKLLQEVTVLFLLFLRNPKLWEIRSVKELVQFLTINSVFDDDKVADCTLTLLHSKRFQIAFVCDGLDEYPQNKNPFILDLIYGQVFPKAKIVCTSRPTASLGLHGHVDRRIEIFGFTKEEREKCITMSLTDSPDKKGKLEKYLKDNPIIDDLCFIPLHLAILMFLFQQGTLPETLTKLNELFVIHTIYRSLKKTHKQYMSNLVQSLADLPEKYYNVICKLSKLAYEGVKHHQLVFTSDEIMLICPEISDMPDVTNGFGLLQAVPYYSTVGAGTTTSYSFLHFTMQEYLAALHVSTLPNLEQFRLLQQTFWNGFFQYMWMMYTGIAGVNSEPFLRFIDTYIIHTDSVILFDSQLDEYKCLHLFQCYTEAKCLEMLEVISSLFKDGNISFHGVSFFQHNFLSLISFLSKSNIQCQALIFNRCGVFGKDLMNVLKWFAINNTDKILTLRYVDLYDNFSNTSPWVVFCAVIKYSLVDDLTLRGGSGLEEYTEQLKESLQNNSTLISLTLCDTTLKDITIVEDILMEGDSTVTTLNISTATMASNAIDITNNILISTAVRNDEAADYSKVLTVKVLHDNVSNSNSETVNLSNQGLYNHEIGCVMFGLQNNTTVKVLDVSNNHITDAGVRVIRDCLLSNSVITELNISRNKISAIAIAEIILANSSLVKLNVSKNGINDKGAEAISDAIKVNSTLQKVNMSCCQISSVGAHFIAEGLCKNSSVQKLDVSINKIFDDGAIAICSCLKDNSTLQKLSMSFNQITNRGAKEIAKAIRPSTNLCELDISGNRMTSEGVIAFLDTIQTNSALQSLYVQFNNITNPGSLEIDQYIKGLNVSLEICASWNDIFIHYGLVAIKTTLHFFNVHSGAPEGVTGETNVDKTVHWLVGCLNDANYAAVLLSTCLKDDSKLTELDLSSVEVTSEGAKTIAEVLQVNKTLQKLDISSQHIGNNGVVAIGENLKDNTTLQELNIAGVGTCEEGIKQFMNVINLNTGLVKLDLSSSWYLGHTCDAIIALSSYLRTNNTLQELILSSIGILGGLEEITKALYVNTTLLKLVVSDNQFYPRGKIIGNLLQNNETLIDLDVSKCFICPEDVKEITGGLQANKSLQSLNISYNNLHDKGIVYFHECLKVNCTLKKLDMSENNIRSEGGKLIGKGIIQLTETLQQLNISHNMLSYEAIETISKYLKDNKSIQKFNISHCCIIGNGPELIAEAIEINTTLRILDISCNWLGDVGIISIANNLKCNNTIQKLNLSSTWMASSGAVKIAEALCVNTALQTLDVSHNILQDVGVTAIGECLKKNSTLQNLNVSFTSFTNLTAIKFAETLQVNTGLHTLNLFTESVVDIDGVTFNMTILKAVHFNTSIIYVKLPHTESVEVENEIEVINQERARQGVHTVCIDDEQNVINYLCRLHSVCSQLSML